MRYFFSADEHYGHRSILAYSKRPFATVEEMNAEIIARSNAVVGPEDVVIHVGDFTLGKKEYASTIIRQLKGKHFFLRGSHDRWLHANAPVMWERTIEGQYVVAMHWAMRKWPRSHYGSWQCFGHSHGHLPPIGKQWDVGVDNNNFTPVSWEQLKEIMSRQPDNADLVKRERSPQ